MKSAGYRTDPDSDPKAFNLSDIRNRHVAMEVCSESI